MTSRTAADVTPSIPDHVTLPPGRLIPLADRGSAFVRHTKGPSDAPTVVLLHGWGATADLNWFRSYGALIEKYSVVAMDHRGHGRGIRADTRFTLRDCADDVVALLDTLGIDRAIVVGYSMGGTIAQVLWRQHPDRMRGIVLCATAATFRSTARERAMFAAIMPTTAIGKLTPARLRNSAALKIMLSKDDRELRLWAQAEIAKHDWMRVLEAGREIGNFDSSGWISGVDVPAAQVMTIHDEIVSLLRQQQLADLIPQASLHLVPGGHSVCIEGPEAFVPALVRAIDSVAVKPLSGTI